MYVPDTPSLKQVRKSVVTEEVELDQLALQRITYEFDADEPISISVEWTEGYLDAEGNYQRVNRRSARISGQSVATEMRTAAVPGSRRGDEMKNAIWAILRAEQHVGQGQLKKKED